MTSFNWFKKSSAAKQDVEGNNNIALQAGGDINYGISTEEFKALSKELGVTQNALENFFKILKEQAVPYQDYDNTLRIIAERYLNNLKELANFQSEDPEVKALITQTEQVLEQGEFDQAEDLINQAKNKDLLAAKKMQENANKRFLSAAEGAARNGELKLTQIKYIEAAGYFQEAADIVPSEFAEKLAYYLDANGSAWYYAGKYPEAEPLYQRSLAILEKTLGTDHPLVATSLNNLAALYYTQGKYPEAESLCQRSLAILEKTLGTDHPNTQTVRNNLQELQVYLLKIKPRS
jgi:tetratricopeptide (TPR) repeat protein